MRTRRSLEEELGPVVCDWLAMVDELGVRVWLDSGTLLGLVRDGEVPAWDRDVDVGAWSSDLATLRGSLQTVSTRHRARLEEKHLDGVPYAFVLKPRVGEGVRALPLAVHLFDREDQRAISSQPHYLLAQEAAYVRRRLATLAEALGGGAALWRARASAPRLALLELLHFLRLGRPLRLLTRLAFAADSRGVVALHPAETRAFGWLFTRLQWSYPLRHVEVLAPIPLETRASSAWIPAESEAYLSFRYGTLWRRPVRDWVYVLDDGAIVHRPGLEVGPGVG